ncbi:MAG: C40 family peptidase [Lachnospiraceae bacterium]|nr:C40 family peptidase [Lachnospiraceae bacterium]
MKRKILCLLLGALMVVSSPLCVLADQEADLAAQKEASSDELDSTMNQIESSVSAQSTLQQEISDLDTQLITLMSDIDILTLDIESTESQIAEKTTELGVAEQKRDKQYADMKTRIQYIYEKGENQSWLSYVCGAETLADLLNRVHYVKEVNEYDRDMLTEYETTVQEIVAIKTDLEAYNVTLNEEQANLETQQGELEAALEIKKQESSNYDAEIAELRSRADELNAQILSANEQLAQISASREAAEAAANSKAAEAAQAQASADAAEKAAADAQAEAAAQQAIAKQAAEAARKDASQKAAAQAAQEAAVKAAQEAAVAQAQQAAAQAAAERAAQQAAQRQAEAEARAQAEAAAAAAAAQAEAEAEAQRQAEAAAAAEAQRQAEAEAQRQAEAAASYSNAALGQQIADFACMWVGGPYVSGGTSLTNGCDCAGFVKAVYANFGYDLIQDPTMQGTCYGTPVGSVAEAQPGDIICYVGGHSAIYIGNNTIVNASNPEYGICVRSPANYRTILAIARLV